MTGPPDRLSGDLGWGLVVLFRAYVKAAEAIADDVPGGNRGYQVLSAAARDEPGSQAAMAQSLGIDRTVMTYLLDDLEAARLVERHADPAHTLQRVGIADVAAERIAGVGWVGDDPALAHDVRGPADQAQLRVLAV